VFINRYDPAFKRFKEVIIKRAVTNDRLKILLIGSKPNLNVGRRHLHQVSQYGNYVGFVGEEAYQTSPENKWFIRSIRILKKSCHIITHFVKSPKPRLYENPDNDVCPSYGPTVCPGFKGG
jgi:hypothetical protein